MAEQKHKLITCRALAPLLRPLVGPSVQVVEMEIGLHLSPQRLRGELMDRIAALEEPGAVILLGYGLCGRALEGVVSSTSRLVLPRVDDCVGALLGSRQRHRDLLLQRAGSYFLTPQWLDTEMNIFEQLARQAARVPPKHREGLLKLALKHYDTLAFVHGPVCSPQDMERGRRLAQDNGLAFVTHPADLGLLERLARGPWSPREFVLPRLGQPITFF